MPRSFFNPIALASAFCFSLSLNAPALADWPQWRGSDFTGAGEGSGYPEKLSPTEGIKWTAAMPGAAASSPIVSGGKVFISAAVESTQKLLALAYDAKTGQKLWEKEVGSGYRSDNKSNFASPSPATDGKVVVFYYGTGDLVAFSPEGQEVWKRNLMTDYGRFATQWTYSTSPVIWKDTLYVQVLQRNKAFDFGGQPKGRSDGPNDSYLLALEPATGKQKWQVIRPSDAVDESLEAFSSPTPFTHEGRSELLISGGDCITGHDPATGKELWRFGSWNPTKIGHWRLVATPVGGGGVVLASAPKQEPIYAIKAGLTGSHNYNQDTPDAKVLSWRTKRKDESTEKHEKDISTDVATPLFYQGHFYILNGDRHNLACLKPDGSVLWNESLPTRAKLEASPTAVDGKIYFMDHKGEAFVVAADPRGFKLLSQASFGRSGDKDTRSSIALSEGCLFIRTNDQLFCQGK